MTELVDSGVVFNPDPHTYFFGEKELFGITPMLSRQLFPNKYDKPENYGNDAWDNKLKKSQNRGHLIHSKIELYDQLGIEDTEEVINYKKIKKSKGFKTIANEYLVTDREYYASAIDLVIEEKDGSISLGDIKTTYKLDTEYLMWQLSVYAYLFENQNPGLSINNLYGLWLRGDKYECVDIERIPIDVIVNLLECDISRRQFVNPYKSPVKTEVPTKVYEVEQYMVDLDNQIKELSEKKQQILDGLLPMMHEANVTSWKGDHIQLIRKAASQRESFDLKKFKEENKDFDTSPYMKVSNVKESITFKVL